MVKFIKFKNRTFNSILLCLLMMTGIAGKALAQEVYPGNEGQTVGTENSRMVVTIYEVGDDEVVLKVSAIGPMLFNVFNTAISYNSNVLYPVAGQGSTTPVPFTCGSTDANYKLFTTMAPLMQNVNGTGVATQSVFTGTTAHDQNGSTTPFRTIQMGAATTVNNGGYVVSIPDGEIKEIYYAYFRKVTSKLPLVSSALEFTVKASGLATTRRGSSWLSYSTKVANYDPGSGKTYVDQNCFSLRSPSLVTTDDYIANGTTVSLKGTASAIGLDKTAGDMGLDWDSITTTGFIYSKSDVALNMDVYSRIIKVGVAGTEYPFPTAGDIDPTDHYFTLGADTFYITETPNASKATLINMEETISGLKANEVYYAYAYMKYKFQTSNEYPVIGSQITFNTEQDLPCPAIATWTGAAGSSDWNDPVNWNAKVNADDADYTTGLIPGKCTYVTIPGDLSYYPVLYASTSPKAKCNVIEFKFGGEVVGTSFLDYDEAKVDLTLQHTRWYMISAPLADMYSGDFFLDESVGRRNPSVSMMKYQVDNPQHATITKQAGKWSSTFNNLEEDLPCSIGFASRINLNNVSGGPASYTFHFPRADSLKYTYYNTDGTISKVGANVRSREFAKNFIYETVSGYNATTGAFAAPIVNGDNILYNNVIVGNPFMAHLKLTDFYNANTESLSGTFQLWTGGVVVETYMLNDGDVVSTEIDEPAIIAPMQSVFAERNTGVAFSTLNFSPDMTTVDVSQGNKLRGAQVNNFKKQLKLHLNRDGKRESGIVIRYKEGASNGYVKGEDALSFFISNLNNQPATLYSVVDSKATSINTVGDLKEDIRLDISTTIKGELTFKIEGVDSFDPSYKIELIDKMKGSFDLRDISSYTFSNETGNVEERFYLRMSQASTDLESYTDKETNIYAANGIVYVNSKEKISQLEIMNLGGQSLYRNLSLDTFQTQVPLNINTGIIIVKVQTEKGTKIEKVFMK